LEDFSVEAFRATVDQLWRLPDKLAAGDPVTDDAVLALVAEFDRRLRTNCGSAAEGMFAAVSPICRFRPGLVGPLMRRALLPLVYLGYDRAEQVQQFVDWLLRQSSTYLPLGDIGRAWLVEDFPRHLEAIQQLLDELVREANTDSEPGRAEAAGV
jgi:hypothetical protein